MNNLTVFFLRKRQKTLEHWKRHVGKCKQNLMGHYSTRRLKDSSAENNSGSGGFMGFQIKVKTGQSSGSIGKTRTLKLLG